MARRTDDDGRRRVTLAAAACLLAFFAVAAPSPVGAQEKKAEPAPDPAADPALLRGPPYFFDLPSMLINLNVPSKRPSFLKIEITVEVAEAGDVATVNRVLPMVLDGVQMYLRELRPEQISGSAGMYRLRQDLVARIAAPSYPAKVKDVLFKELLVQ